MKPPVSRTSGWPAALAFAALTALALPAAGPRLALAAPHRATTTITFWYGADVDPSEKVNMQKLIVAPFEKAYPNIKLQLSFKANLTDLTKTTLAAGTGPDIVTADGPTTVVQYAESHLVTDLTPYAKKYDWAHKIFPWALDSGRYKGGLYGIPNQYETIIIYYNQTMFKKYGWKPATTWSQFEALCRAVAAKSIIPISFGTIGWRPAVEWMVGTFFGHDAGPYVTYEALTGKSPWTNPLLVDAMAKYNELWQNGWLMDKKAFGTTLDQAWALMKLQRAAMKMEGTWAFPSVTQAASSWQWDWMPYPIARSGVPQNYDLSIGGTLSINAHTRNKAAAATFLNWLYSDPKREARIIAAIPGDWVLPISIPASDFPKSYDPRFLRALLAIQAASRSGHFTYPTWTFFPPKTEQKIIDDVYRLFNGDITPQKMMADVQKSFLPEFKSGAVPPVPKPATP